MPAKNLTANRAALGHRVAYALRHPDRVPRHLARSSTVFGSPDRRVSACGPGDHDVSRSVDAIRCRAR
jgi:hypothetical protein